MTALSTSEPTFEDVFELRVLEGEQKGARSRVPFGQPITVSGDLDSDIVLRGADACARSLRLTARPGGVQVEVLAGEVAVGEQRLHAGDSLQVDPGTPLDLGDTAIGVGPVRRPDWSIAEASEVVPPVGEETGAAEAAETIGVAAPAATAEAPCAPARRWWQGLVVGGGALAAVSMGMLAFAYTVAPAAPSAAQRAARAEAVLHGAGLSRLVAKAEGDGVVVSGYLETAAQRARAEQLLSSEQLPAQLKVWVNEQVASAVVDVYRVNGVTAQAEATGPGMVAVSTHEGDAARLEEIRAIARRDVPGLAAIEVRNAPPPRARTPTPVVDDPGKRVASIVPGDPPYVVTADGTRYFEGALLPTGHRIAGIAQHQVLLEKDGDRTPLAF